jgi:hypothetical protein
VRKPIQFYYYCHKAHNSDSHINFNRKVKLHRFAFSESRELVFMLNFSILSLQSSGGLGHRKLAIPVLGFYCAR